MTPPGNEDTNSWTSLVEAMQKQGETQALILSRLTEISQGQARLTEQVADLSAKVQKHDETLRGNGRAGLISMLDQLVPLVREHQETLRGSEEKAGLVGRMRAIEERVEMMARPMLQVGMIIITAVITAVIALVIR